MLECGLGNENLSQLRDQAKFIEAYRRVIHLIDQHGNFLAKTKDDLEDAFVCAEQFPENQQAIKTLRVMTNNIISKNKGKVAKDKLSCIGMYPLNWSHIAIREAAKFPENIKYVTDLCSKNWLYDISTLIKEVKYKADNMVSSEGEDEFVSYFENTKSIIQNIKIAGSKNVPIEIDSEINTIQDNLSQPYQRAFKRLENAVH
jgi:hypothetical protein